MCISEPCDADDQQVNCGQEAGSEVVRWAIMLSCAKNEGSMTARWKGPAAICLSLAETRSWIGKVECCSSAVWVHFALRSLLSRRSCRRLASQWTQGRVPDVINALLNNGTACGCASAWQHIEYPPALSPKSVMRSASLPKLGTKCWIHFRSVCWSYSPRLLLLVGVNRRSRRWGKR